MYDGQSHQATLELDIAADPIAYLRHELGKGRDWPETLLEAMSIWYAPIESFDGRIYKYVVGGEAFDWLTLAERLFGQCLDLVPRFEAERLLFTGRLPDRFDRSLFKDLLGVHKYRGYLNYFYGVVVEEALHCAVEREVHKRYLSNGKKYHSDFADEAFTRIYHESRVVLFEQFQNEAAHFSDDLESLSDVKEWTYWLFKYRLRTADKAKIASDTRKGLEQLRQVTTAYMADLGPY
jgi:hypothetical protein